MLTLAMLAVVGGCEWGTGLKALAPGLGFGAGNTVGTTIATIVLNMLGITVA